MPRPKVDPQNRQRTVIACLPCKRAKIRCDSRCPCATCVKRGREASCVYQESPSSPSQARRRSRTITQPTADGQQPSNVSQDVVQPTPESSADGDFSATDESQGPRCRMLFSSKFQKVYIGRNASLSYLQFLRNTVKHRIGPCAFTEGDFNSFMLESDVQIANSTNPLATGLAQNERESYARTYLHATSGLIDICTKDELSVALGAPPQNSPVDTATLSLILAIGAQCRGRSPLDLHHATSFLSHGQKLSFLGMLRDPSLEMVRNFLLMAFYMLGACHRNAAFMYFGVAAQAASALGLHRHEQYHGLPAEECRARVNTWKSLRVLNTIYNSILGRSGSLPRAQHDRLCKHISENSEFVDTARETALQATFDICPFMDELEQREWNQDVASTEHFLHRLQKWSKALPPELRQSTEALTPASASIDHELYVGGMHVACTYYFAVILTTRRFLTLHFLDKLRDRTPADNLPKVDDNVANLADVCLHAAINLARVAYNAMVAQQMLGNMAIIKAWMFAAGLLLGFSLFAQRSGPDNEAEESFQEAQAVLRKISELSPQAGHYYEILKSLSNAIVVHQRKLLEDRKLARSRYMDQIFTSGVNNSERISTNVPSPAGIISGDITLPESDGNPSMALFQTTDVTDCNVASLPFAMTSYEGFPWPADDFSFEWESNEPLFDDVL